MHFLKRIPGASYFMALAMIAGLSQVFSYSELLSFIVGIIIEVAYRFWSAVFFWVTLPFGIPEFLSAAALILLTTYRGIRTSNAHPNTFPIGMLHWSARTNTILFGYLFFVLGVHPELHVLNENLHELMGRELVGGVLSAVTIVFAIIWMFLSNNTEAFKLAFRTLASAYLQAAIVIGIDQLVIVPLTS